MPTYYLDLETEGINPETDKIITIQFSKREMRNNNLGQLEFSNWSPLTIFKVWESSEEDIVKRFHSIFFGSSVWDFIPLGNNLMFEFNFLFKKFKKYNLKCPDFLDFIYKKPFIDIRNILLLSNDLQFKGCSLENFTDKICNGSEIPNLYEKKEYDKIINYIKMEYESFVKLVDNCLCEFPKIIKKKSLVPKHPCSRCGKEMNEDEYETLGHCVECD